jgi:hypothetical protein
VGLSEQRAREIVAAVIRDGGIGALQISDKPELEAAFQRFIGAFGEGTMPSTLG